MHYKTRANVYMVLGRGVVGSCFGVRYCSYLGGGVSRVGDPYCNSPTKTKNCKT